MRKSFRKWLVLITILCLLAVVVHHALNATLGRVLVDVFSEGSGCRVILHNPRIRYFPLRAQIQDVHIFHPEEGAERGYHADLVAIEVDFFKLFAKRVIIPKLTLLGSDVVAVQENTALYRVLEFIFKKRPPPAPGTPKPWHSFISSGWRPWVPLVEVTTKPGADRLKIGLPGLQVHFDQAVVIIRDPEDNPNVPAEFTAQGENARVMLAGAPPLPLGGYQSSGKIFRGTWTFEQMQFTDTSAVAAADRTSKISVTGRLSTPGDGAYNLQVSAELFDEYVSRLAFPAREYLQQLGPKILANLHLTGPLLRPEADGDVAFEFLRGAPLAARDDCAFKVVSAHFHASPTELRIDQVKAEDIIDNTEFVLSFDDQLSVRGSAAMVLDETSSFLSRCLAAGAEKSTPAEPIAVALNEALADSRTEFSFEGALRSLAFTGRLTSDIYVRDPSARSRLQADVNLRDSVLVAEINERGAVSQISGRAADAAGSDTARLNAQQHSNLSAVMRYELASRQLAVSKLALARYPAERVLARAGPFLEAHTFTRLLNTISRGTLIDAHGEVALDLADISGALPSGTGSGEVRVSELTVAGVAVEQLVLPWELAGAELRLDNMRLESPAGAVTASLALTKDLQLKLAGSSQNFALEKLPQLVAVGSQTRLAADVEFSAEGELTNPAYKLSATVTSSMPGAPSHISQIAVTGDLKQLTAKGSLMDQSASFEVQTPLDTSSKGQLTASLIADNLPLDEFVGGPVTPGVSKSFLSGSLTYSGSTAAPLKGSGQISIDRLRISKKSVTIEAREPLKASIADGRLTFTSVRLYLDEKKLEILGFVDQQSGWQSSVVGDWELDGLVSPVQSLEQISGNINVDIQIRGAVATPDLDGSILMKDASISFPLGKTIVGADEATARLEVEGDRIEILDVSARVGDGVLRGNGSVVNLFNNAERKFQMFLSIDRTRVEPINNLAMSFTGGLTLEQLGPAPLKVTGTITILDALYEQKLNLLRLLRELAQYVTGVDTGTRAVRLPVTGGGGQQNVLLDLRVQAANDLLIDTDIAQVELVGDLHISGTVAELAVDGSIASVDGVFRLGASEFDIVTGQLLFDPDDEVLDPRVNILAETRVDTATGETQRVSVSVSGTLGAPKVKFSSDSGLSESEIVSLFGLGGGGFAVLTKGKEEYTFRELIDPRSRVGLRDRLVGIAGFSEVQVDTALSEDSGEFVPRVRAKRPIAGDLKFTVQSELGGQQVSTLGMDYPLTPYLNMVTGWKSRSATNEADTTTGTYNAGLEYKRAFPGLSFLPSFETPVNEVKQ